MSRPEKTDLEFIRHFWSLVDIHWPHPPKEYGAWQNECWEWQGQVDSKGYGTIWRHGKKQRAHRIAYEKECGDIPSGMLICHHCDNKRCINPIHLFVGTRMAL